MSNKSCFKATLVKVFCSILLVFVRIERLYANGETLIFHGDVDLELTLYTDGIGLPIFPGGITQEMWRYADQNEADILSSLTVRTRVQNIIFTPSKITFVFNYPYDFDLKHPDGKIEKKVISQWSITASDGLPYGEQEREYLRSLVTSAGRQLYVMKDTPVSIEEL